MQLMVGYLHIIISKIIQALPLAMKIKTDETFIKILCYLSQHYAERISLKTLSKKFGLSEEHISRSFRQKIGKTFLSHLHALRVEHAKILLKSSVLTITVVAYESGFVDLRTFNRVFKTLEGVTPSEYRKQGDVIWAKTKK